MGLFSSVGAAVRWVAGAVGTVVMTIIEAVVYVVQSTVDAVATLTARVFPRNRIEAPL